MRSVLGDALGRNDEHSDRRLSQLRLAFNTMSAELKFCQYVACDQILLSNAFWMAFECDVSGKESREFALWSTDHAIAWPGLPAHHTATWLCRRILVMALETNDKSGNSLTEVNAILDEKRDVLSMLPNGEDLKAFIRKRYCSMMASKLCSEARVPKDDVLALLDFKLRRSLTQNYGHGLDDLREELNNGISSLVSVRLPGGLFLALQLLRRWHALTHPSLLKIEESKARTVQLLTLGLRDHDVLALIGGFETLVDIAMVSKDRMLFETVSTQFDVIPEELFSRAHLPSKAVYKAVFATRWAVGIGNCADMSSTGIAQLVRDCGASFPICGHLAAQPFVDVRYGLAFHYCGLGRDLLFAMEGAGLTDVPSGLHDLAIWLMSHTEVSFHTLSRGVGLRCRELTVRYTVFRSSTRMNGKTHQPEVRPNRCDFSEGGRYDEARTARHDKVATITPWHAWLGMLP